MSDPSPAPFSREDVARMVSHMNDDHADSVLAYAQHFGQCRDATAATLIDVTADAMTVSYTHLTLPTSVTV